jgi:predicted metal-dependent peptidase
MAGSYTREQRAAGKIRLSIDRLAGTYPFHAAVLERFKVVARPEVGTMAVTVAGDEILLLHNPAFVLDTAADSLAGVLLHEIHHVVLGHLLADPADYPDVWARTVAEEVTVNEFVALPLPQGAITLDCLPGLPLLESTSRRYDRLRKVRRRFPITRPPEVLAPSGPAGGRTDQLPGVSEEEKGGDAVPGQRRRHDRPGGSGAVGRLVDDHSVWGDARQDLRRSREAIRELVQQALLAVAPERLPTPLLQAMGDALGIGHQPGGNRQELRGDGPGSLDWRRLLHRHVGRILERQPTFNRPPRRFPELVGILPGQKRQPTRPRVLAIIDTSGSITPYLLERIDAELVRLARRFSVTIVECDARIQRVYPYRRLRAVVGRGGTDLRPPLERSFLRRQRTDLVIYFTDGQGPAATDPPGPPVIWCLVPGGKVPAPWGRAIRMEDAPPSTSGLSGKNRVAGGRRE